jgi:hypothetical protein
MSKIARQFTLAAFEHNENFIGRCQGQKPQGNRMSFQ